MSETLFKFKEFDVNQAQSAMKINTDGVLLGAWVDVSDKTSILDIGTGSGVIAMMVAQRSSADNVVGVEIDENSYLEAKKNMSACPWCDSLQAVHISIQDFASKSEDKFDLLISNPPFFSGGTLSATQSKSLVRHTTKLSHTDLLRSSYNLLSEDGDFAVVLPHIEGLRFIELAEQYRLFNWRITEVNSFPDSPVERLLLCFSKVEKEVVRTSISIRNKDKEFSKEYRELTKDFYLKF